MPAIGRSLVTLSFRHGAEPEVRHGAGTSGYVGGELSSPQSSRREATVKIAL